MDILLFVGLINLFFVPMLPLYLRCKRAGQPIKPSLDLLFQYGVATALNVPLTKIIIYFPSRFLPDAGQIISSYYTIAALIAALLLSAPGTLLKTLSIQVEYKKIEKEEDGHGKTQE